MLSRLDADGIKMGENGRRYAIEIFLLIDWPKPALVFSIKGGAVSAGEGFSEDFSTRGIWNAR